MASRAAFRAPVGLWVVFLRFGHGAAAAAELTQMLPVCRIGQLAALPGFMDLMVPVGLSVLVHTILFHFDVLSE